MKKKKEKMKFDAIIFDWAGTTVDYGSFAPVKAFIEAFEEFGITPTVEEVRKPMGMLKIDHIRTMMQMERISNLWTEKYIKKVYELSEKKVIEIVGNFATPKPYVVETIKKLKDLGLKIGSTTGYTDEMMSIVVPKAKEYGYEPDCWFSPDSTNKIGRPYPYMIFKNMEKLKLKSVSKILKVGDTISDIKEGKNAGVITVGIIEGSSQMGLTEEEYNNLTDIEKEKICDKVSKEYFSAGAYYVIKDIREILDLVK